LILIALGSRLAEHLLEPWLWSILNFWHDASYDHPGTAYRLTLYKPVYFILFYFILFKTLCADNKAQTHMRVTRQGQTARIGVNVQIP